MSAPLNRRTGTAMRHDPAGPTMAEQERIKAQREQAAKSLCLFVLIPALALLLVLRLMEVGL